MSLQITTHHHETNTAVLTIEGRLNAVTANDLKNNIKALVADQKNHLILDLAKVTFIDSSGLSAIVSGLKTTREQGGSLKLVGLSDKTKRVFELTRLARVFEFYPDVEKALEASL